MQFESYLFSLLLQLWYTYLEFDFDVFLYLLVECWFTGVINIQQSLICHLRQVERWTIRIAIATCNLILVNFTSYIHYCES